MKWPPSDGVPVRCKIEFTVMRTYLVASNGYAAHILFQLRRRGSVRPSPRWQFRKGNDMMINSNKIVKAIIPALLTGVVLSAPALAKPSDSGHSAKADHASASQQPTRGRAEATSATPPSAIRGGGPSAGVRYALQRGGK